MKKPLVAVIGRPNVGKSTFFNKICGKRISIVKDTPGVTRDRIYADAEWCGRVFTLVDTGGIDFADDTLTSEVTRQAEVAIELADVIVFLVDGREGLMPDDREIADRLRRTQKPVIIAVNKLDNYEVELTYDFYQLGLGEVLAISCEQGKGLGDLLDEIIKDFDFNEEQPSESLKIAVVGKPNVGKSSLINKILGYERVIVSDIAGTTRDAIDTPFTKDGKDYILIDTAGLRRKRAIESQSVERYSVLRTLSAIRRADIVLVLIDAQEPITEQDVKIAGLVHEEGKPSIIVINKWDAVEKDTYTIEAFEKQLKIDLAFMDYYKSIYISAKTGKRVDRLFPLIEEVYQNNSRRISTGTLNHVIREAVEISEPPSFAGKRLKIYYVTQPSTNPPKFVFFVNDKKVLHFSYERYLENQLRKAFDFSGTPITLSFVQREEEK